MTPTKSRPPAMSYNPRYRTARHYRSKDLPRCTRFLNNKQPIWMVETLKRWNTAIKMQFIYHDIHDIYNVELLSRICTVLSQADLCQQFNWGIGALHNIITVPQKTSPGLSHMASHKCQNQYFGVISWKTAWLILSRILWWFLFVGYFPCFV